MSNSYVEPISDTRVASVSLSRADFRAPCTRCQLFVRSAEECVNFNTTVAIEHRCSALTNPYAKEIRFFIPDTALAWDAYLRLKIGGDD